MALRFLWITTKVMYNGAKITFRSLAKSIMEEVELSNEKARIRNKEKLLERPSVTGHLSVQEAMQILNISTLDPMQIDCQFRTLFKANDKRQGGSLYLQSKILRAKERLDMQIAQDNFVRNYNELERH